MATILSNTCTWLVLSVVFLFQSVTRPLFKAVMTRPIAALLLLATLIPRSTSGRLLRTMTNSFERRIVSSTSFDMVCIFSMSSALLPASFLTLMMQSPCRTSDPAAHVLFHLPMALSAKTFTIGRNFSFDVSSSRPSLSLSDLEILTAMSLEGGSGASTTGGGASFTSSSSSRITATAGCWITTASRRGSSPTIATGGASPMTSFASASLQAHPHPKPDIWNLGLLAASTTQ
mmetsp:Transcript_75241/g.121478  ORF Transcript_75241/g.121478 Transcript_75241/m.121478 type:complete len:232 (+) Transcript_75241:212-907(+)